MCVIHQLHLKKNPLQQSISNCKQRRSHWGGKGGRVPPLTVKICQKSGKRGENQEKIRKKRKNRKEKAKIGKFLSLCPSWQIGLAMLLIVSAIPRQERANQHMFQHTYTLLPGFKSSYFILTCLKIQLDSIFKQLSKNMNFHKIAPNFTYSQKS